MKPHVRPGFSLQSYFMRRNPKKTKSFSDVSCGLSDAAIEFACAVKALYREYGVKSSDLCKFGYLDALNTSKEKFRHIRTIPISLPMPESLQGGEETLDITFSPNPSFFEDVRDRGLHELQFEFGGRKIRLWRYISNNEWAPMGPFVCFVERKNLKTFYRLLRGLQRSRHGQITVPVLPGKMLEEIYRNSVGFLRRGDRKETMYRDYGIPYKRGILLSGRPGTGKTLTCKWLREMCVQKGLMFKIVTMQNYRQACSHGSVSQLFRLPGRGLIFFDDMDMMVKDRNESGSDLYTFLSEMDGIDTKEGIVYIFTTNEIEKLDAAFVRPGRIDLFLIFKTPNERLRHRFVESRFHKEIQDKIDVADLVKRTNEYSFAELEEIRKLFCLDLLDNKEINLDTTMKLFDAHRTEFAERSKFGFGQMGNSENEEDGLYCEDVFALPPEFWGGKS